MPRDRTTPDIIHPADVTVRASPGRGRGVFARRGFAANETIEVCPVVALSAAEARKLDGTALYDYYFGWGRNGEQAAIVLGYGSLYNHSFAPNAEHRKNFAEDSMSVVALRPIAAGEEIFIRYETAKGDDRQAVWFDVR